MVRGEAKLQVILTRNSLKGTERRGKGRGKAARGTANSVKSAERRGQSYTFDTNSELLD